MSSRRSVAGLLRPIIRAQLRTSRLRFATANPSSQAHLQSLLVQIRSLHQTPLLRLSEQLDSHPKVGSSENVDFIDTFKELGVRNLVADSVLQSVVDDMKLETMTPVQVQTINPCLGGSDLIAQAKTGTGKTLGFLIPVIQRILSEKPHLAQARGIRREPPDIRAIIISPTRELAEQIAVEAKKLVRHTGLKVQTAVGGTQKSFHLRQLRNEGCHILVGTPGRLQDILSDPMTDVRAPNLDALVLDEADRLLDDGFGPAIMQINDECLPRKDVKDRQTLMFSATMPKEVLRTVKRLMKRDFKFVRTVSADDTPTHEKVPQFRVDLAGMENSLPALVELIKREKSVGEDTDKPFKAIVFLNSNAEVLLYNEIFEHMTGSGRRFRRPSEDSKIPLAGLPTTQMTSKLTQAQRTRNSESFRKMKSGVLFSSDVSARGMDFPNVTHVIQMGLAKDRESYIHRIGRTGRGDKSGQAYTILSPVDQQEARYRLKSLPMEQDTSLQTASVDMTQDGQVPASVATILTHSIEAIQSCDRKLLSDVYRAFLGVYGWADKRQLIENMNNMARYCWAMEQPPAISPTLVHKLGFGKIPGIVKGTPEDEPRRSSSYGGDRDSGRDRSFGRGGGGFSRGGDRGFDRDGGKSYGRGGGGFDRSSGRGSDRAGARGGGGFDRSSGRGSDRAGGRGGGGFDRGSGRDSDRSGRSGGYSQRSFDRTPREQYAY